jgi:hypothetical protein
LLARGGRRPPDPAAGAARDGGGGRRRGRERERRGVFCDVSFSVAEAMGKSARRTDEEAYMVKREVMGRHGGEVRGPLRQCVWLLREEAPDLSGG